MEVLIIGYGSIGKQHSQVVLELGHTPVVVTQYPDNNKEIQYLRSIEEIENADAAIICSPTYNHITDFINIATKTNIKKILIEKPITSNVIDALEIKRIAASQNISVYVAFDMRFIPLLQYVNKHISSIKSRIRLVKIHCGQYLPEWRVGRDYRKSYSSDKNKGGGVDLDLTHEIDYMLWLFGLPYKTEYINTFQISTLEINSPDYFKAIYKYKDFLIDVELDYFRKKDRKLIIIGENENLVELDFIKNTLFFTGKRVFPDTQDGTLLSESKAFLDDEENEYLCTLDESIDVLKVINR